MSRNVKGFTLVEIMIVVAIIGLLAAIAVPSFMKARNTARRNACINNLRQIDGAKDEYILEYGGSNQTVIAWSNIEIYVKDLTNKVYCPNARGTSRYYSVCYTINTLLLPPECRLQPGTTTTPEHSLAYKSK